MSEHGTHARYCAGCHCQDCRAAESAYQLQRRAERQTRSLAEVPHGTIGGYVNWRCRCSECRAAQAAYQREYTAVLRNSSATRIHGRRSTYQNWGCRCAECAAANAAYRRSRRAAAGGAA